MSADPPTRIVEPLSAAVDDLNAEIYRLYQPEWVTVHTVYIEPETPVKELMARAKEYATRFAGRVHDHDLRFEHHPEHAVVGIQLHIPNLKGEFKFRYQAAAWAEEQGLDEYTVVARNSPADYDLRTYGLRRLPRT